MMESPATSAQNSPGSSIHDAVDSLVENTVANVGTWSNGVTSEPGDQVVFIDTELPIPTVTTSSASQISHGILPPNQPLPLSNSCSAELKLSKPPTPPTAAAPIIQNQGPAFLFDSSGSTAFPCLKMNTNNLPFDSTQQKRWSVAGVNNGSPSGQSDVRALKGKLDYFQDQLQLLTLENREMTANYKCAVGELDSRRQADNEMKANSQRLQAQFDSANQEKQLLQQQVLQMKMRLDYKADEVNELKTQVEQLRTQRGATPFDAPCWADDLLKQWEQLEEQRVEQEKHRCEMMTAYEQLHKLAQDRDILRSRCDSSIQQRDEARNECNKLQIGKQRSDEQAANFLSKYHAMQEEYLQVMSERETVLKESQDASEQKEVMESRLRALNQENAALKMQIKMKGDNSKLDNEKVVSSEEEVANITRSALDKQNTELHVVLQNMKTQIKTQRGEIEEARSNRDWALEERKRVVSERESMRAMCDQLRRERDDAITRLADAIKDTDDLHRQREEAERQLGLYKEEIDKRDQPVSSPSHSRDSAIESDMAEWDIETLNIELPDSKNDDLGIEIRGGLDDPVMGTNVPIYVKNIEKGSKLDGKLRTFDCITQLNDIDVSNMEYKAVMDILYKCNSVKMVVKRRRLLGMKLISVPIDTDSLQNDCGLVFEDGIHISKIKMGSSAAKTGTLAVGDRLVSINSVPVEGKTANEINGLILQLQKSSKGIELAVMKSPPVLSPITPSTSFGTSISSNTARSNPEHPDRTGRSMLERTTQLCQPQPVMASVLPTHLEETTKHKPKQSSKLLDMVHDKIFGKDKKSTVKASVCIQQSSDTIRHERNGSFATVNPRVNRPMTIYNTLSRRGNSAFTSTSSRNKQQSSGVGNDETSALNQLDNVLNDADSTITREKVGKSSSSDKNCGGTWPKYRQNVVNEAGSVASTLSQKPKKINARPTIFPVFPAVQQANEQRNNNNNQQNGGSPLSGSVMRRPGPRMAPVQRPLTYHPQSESPISRVPVPPIGQQPPHSARGVRDVQMTAISPPPYSDRGIRPPSDHYRLSGDNRRDYANGVSAQFITDTQRGQLQYLVRPQPAGRRQPSNYVPPPPYPGSNYARQANYDEFNDYEMDIHSITSQSSGSAATGLGDLGGHFSHSSSLHATPRQNTKSRQTSGGLPYALPNNSCSSPFRPVSIDSSTRLSAGDIRKICIEKGSSCEFLGIKVLDNKGQGIFVSEVNKNSLASKNGVYVGDQILDVCGINMRNADIRAAKQVLRQLGRSEQITLTVQYNPADRSAGASTSLDWHSTSSTPTAFARGKGLVSRESSTHSNATHSREMLASISECESVSEPRPAMIRKEGDRDWGFTLCGGNAIGIFVEEINEDSPAAGPEGLRVGDRILEFNGINFRKLTLEQAMYELQRTCDDDVFVLAQQSMKKLQECKRRGAGDSFYIRVNVDRPTDNQDELPLKQGDIVYVDKTVFMGEPGRWRAWRLDQEARERSCGIIPSKYKLEEEFLMKRSGSEISSGDAASEGGGSRRGTIRRSLKFMRRSSRNSQQHQRTPSKESKDPLDSDTLPFLDDLYQRVERLDYKRKRPVVLIGPLGRVITHRLVEEYPAVFAQCVPECVNGPLNKLEQGLMSGLYLEFSKRDQLFQVTTVSAVKEWMDKGYHCLLDVSPDSLERMHRLQIYPVVMHVKFKHAKQVKELSEFLADRVHTKDAKEMIDRANDIEARLSHINYQTCIVSVSAQQHVDNTVRLLCQQILSAVEHEQKKTLWIISNDTV